METERVSCFLRDSQWLEGFCESSHVFTTPEWSQEIKRIKFRNDEKEQPRERGEIVDANFTLGPRLSGPLLYSGGSSVFLSPPPSPFLAFPFLISTGERQRGEFPGFLGATDVDGRSWPRYKTNVLVQLLMRIGIICCSVFFSSCRFLGLNFSPSWCLS